MNQWGDETTIGLEKREVMRQGSVFTASRDAKTLAAIFLALPKLGHAIL